MAAAGIRWLGIFVLTCVCSAQRRGYGYLLLVASAEVIRGFMGYFGDFKEVLFVVLIGLFSVRPRLNPRSILSGFVVATILLTLGAFWSANKGDYRTFISQGEQAQVVLVPIQDRAAFLADRIFEADWQMLKTGFEQLAKRWGYVDLLAATMSHVP